MHDVLLNEMPTITKERFQLWKPTTINLLTFHSVGHWPPPFKININNAW